MNLKEIREKYIVVTHDAVWLKIGVQMFHVYVQDDDEDLREWYAEMLTKAVAKLIEEQ
jgi:hypothetical protein